MPNTLREVRKQAGLTQLDIAKKLDFASTDRICRWEKGQTFPHVINLFKLCALYNASPHELYGELIGTIEKEIESGISELSSTTDLKTDEGT